jgi:hypothetical protein
MMLRPNYGYIKQFFTGIIIGKAGVGTFKPNCQIGFVGNNDLPALKYSQ